MTSAIGVLANVDGKLLTEDSPIASWNPRGASEVTVKELAARGVHTSVVRLPQVHNTVKQGFVTALVETARRKGVSAYPGEGLNSWSAAHISDVAQLYRLAFEKAEAGAIYHAVDEEGVTMKAIAEAIGRSLQLPAISVPAEESETHFGWLGRCAGHDMSASGTLTQQRLNWKPAGPGLISDLDQLDSTRA